MKKPIADCLILGFLTLGILLGYAGLFIILTGCSFRSSEDALRSYGVFLGADASDLEMISSYDTVVIDAQYYDEEDITYLKENGCTVLSYINLGSIEDFRPYYGTYESLTLDDYEHWSGEKWVDVSSPLWQTFLTEELAPSIIDKGVDGLFVDNTDVYYFYQTEGIYNGICSILEKFKALGTYICINGGDLYVMRYINDNGDLDLIDAVNQETVFSSILWNEDSFGKADPDDTGYYCSYIEAVAAYGKDVYLLEYTTDNKLIGEIRSYCRKHGFLFYISSSLELAAE